MVHATTEVRGESGDRSWFWIECHRAELDTTILTAIAELTMTTVAQRLGIESSGFDAVRVVVSDRMNSVVDREIWIAPRPAGRGYSTYDWFELLFAHELTHLLIQDAWGLPPVLWWEGMAVHLGDDRVRARLFGHDYHVWCRALDELGRMLPLEPLLRASTYYRRRPDIRVDLQAGSFCGFLLQTRGPGLLGRFLAEAHPIGELGGLFVDTLLERHLGADLDGLQSEWIRFLRADVNCAPSVTERLRALSSDGAPDGREHCDHCFTVQDGTNRCLCSRAR
jgi:hypothetical protein